MPFCDKMHSLWQINKINFIRSENKEGNAARSENKSGKDGDNTVRKLLIEQSEHKDNAPNIDLNYMDLEELRKRAERVAQRKK